MSTRICLTHLGGGHEDRSQMAPWVKRDVQILEAEAVPRPFMYGSWKDVPALATRVLGSDMSLNWFAWDNALWALRLGRAVRIPGIVILGGFDVANQPLLRYGATRSREGQRKVRKILEMAAWVFAVSNYTKSEASRITTDVEIEVLYHGLASEDFPPGPPPAGRRAVCSVADITPANYRRKGILEILEVARYLDDIPVLIAGRISPESRGITATAPANVKFLDFVPRERLVRVYQDSRVYLQLSRHEGFGLSVAESMLCRCSPVVTRAGALPEVVGDVGTYVDLDDPEGIAEAVRRTFDSPEMGERARMRAVREFPIQRRRDRLLRVIQEVSAT